MRTVQQVVQDLKCAEKAEAEAAAVTLRYRNELQAIYAEAKSALGISDIFPR